MSWQKISNIASILSIAGAIGSGFSLFKIKGYYKEIAEKHNFEKLTSPDSEIIKARNLYENIRKFHFAEDKQGRNLQNIVNNHLKIDTHLNEIRKNIPSKYNNILESINSANKQIDMICGESLYYKNNSYFSELGTHLTNIEEGIKSEKENIRGF